MLTYDKIQHIFKHSSVDEVEIFVDTFNKHSKKFNFTSKFQVNAFLAQLKEEVGVSLTPKRENLNYSCKALRAIFGYYKRNPKSSRRDGRCRGHRANQRKIANKAYGGRLGNKKPNDGWTFRGAGYIQLTGRANYKHTAKVMSTVLKKNITPTDLSNDMNTVEGALLSAMAFYYSHKMYAAKNVDEMTKIVNKRTHSYKARKRHYFYIASL